MMAGNRRQEIAKTIQRERVSAIIRTADQETASNAMQAAVDGGIRLAEFTLTTPGAFELIAEFAKKPEIVVGAGTVMTPEQAQQAVGAGARFLVSPVCDAEVLAESARLEVPTIPGASTPTEMQRAHELGADFVKVFPAPFGGADFVRAVRGPMPHLRLFPTAGVTPENFVEFLDAGCVGVGFVATLFTPANLSARNYDAIRDRASTIMGRLKAWSASR